MGSIYFIHAPSVAMVKIGFTAQCPDVRLRRLAATCPVELEPLALIANADVEYERALHRRFIAHWSHGEWFHAHPSILEYARISG